MKFSVCVDSLYYRKDVVEGMELIQKAGFEFFEFWSWRNKNLSQVKRAMEQLQLQAAAFCVESANLVDPSKRHAFLEEVRDAIEKAHMLSCSQLIVTTGNAIDSMTREEQHQSIVEGLKMCVPTLTKERITLLVEPLNVIKDHPGYFLTTSEEAFRIVREVNSPAVKVLYDIYHQQITEGNLLPTMLENLSWIGHIHAAGHPGRVELDRGEIHYVNLLQVLAEAGYDRFVGLEYFPLDDPFRGLERMNKLLSQLKV